MKKRNKIYTNSAPGRICLVGEHCDYANGKAIALPIQNKVKALGQKLNSNTIIITTKINDNSYKLLFDLDKKNNLTETPLKYSAAAIKVLLEIKSYRKKIIGSKIKLTSNLPIQKGLSSSAAATVATIRILSDLYNLKLSDRKIAEFAYIAEHDVVGINCGRMDQLVSSYNSPILMHFSQKYKPRVDKLSYPANKIYILVATPTNSHRNIKGILDDCNRAYFNPKTKAHRNFKKTLDDLIPNQVVKPLRNYLKRGDIIKIGEMMRLNQQLYYEYFLPISPHFQLNRLTSCFDQLKQSGSLGEKWTGAGGEGSFVSIFDSNKKRKIAKDNLLRKSKLKLQFIESTL